MRRAMLLVMLLLLLGGGGFAAWTFGKPLLEQKQAEAAAEAAAPLYVSMDPLIVPVIENNRVTHHLTISLSLEVAGISGDAKLRDALPRVVDAFNAELYGLMSLRFVREGGVSLPLVKQRLLLAGQRELGAGVVTDVLIRGIERLRGQRKAQS